MTAVGTKRRIELKFQDCFRDMLLSGRKTMTIRKSRHGEPGNTFIAFGAEFEIIAVHQLQLGTVLMKCYREEGYSTPDEFIAALRQLYPDHNFQADELVWTHQFKKVGY